MYFCETCGVFWSFLGVFFSEMLCFPFVVTFFHLVTASDFKRIFSAQLNCLQTLLRQKKDRQHYNNYSHTTTAVKMIFWTISKSVMWRRSRDWASTRSTAYRSLKRDTRRAWREEWVSWALVGDSLLTGLDERLSLGKGLGERLLTNLRGGNKNTNSRQLCQCASTQG